MAVTAETLPRHELIGLDAAVTRASNPDLVGVQGRVVTETTKTLGLEGEDRIRHVPKAEATLEFALPTDGRVQVEGDRLVARPARRSETTGDSTWR